MSAAEQTSADSPGAAGKVKNASGSALAAWVTAIWLLGAAGIVVVAVLLAGVAAAITAVLVAMAITMMGAGGWLSRRAAALVRAGAHDGPAAVGAAMVGAAVVAALLVLALTGTALALAPALHGAAMAPALGAAAAVALTGAIASGLAALAAALVRGQEQRVSAAGPAAREQQEVLRSGLSSLEAAIRELAALPGAVEAVENRAVARELAAAEARGAATKQLLDGVAEQLQGLGRGLQAHLEQVREAGAANEEGLEAQRQELHDAAVRRLEDGSRALLEQLERAEQQRQREQAMDAQALGEVAAELGGVAASLRAQAEAGAIATEARGAELSGATSALQAAVEALVAAVDRQSEAAELITGAAEARAAQIEDGIGQLAFAGSSLAEVAAGHSEAQEALERRLLMMHKAAFDAAAARLDELGSGLTTAVRSAVESAQEASEAVRAGGGELSAAAEMFAESVDRHRSAANFWLESLGAVEAAVQEAGEHAAADVLAEQLSATHELFSQQLVFHRELFDQLRSLRAALPAPPPASDRPRAHEAA